MITAIAVGLALPTFAFGRTATNISIKDNFFTPETPAARSFQTGPSFHWSRAAGSGGAHNVFQDAGLFKSGGLTSGPINFTISASAGSYHYYCQLHGSPAGGMAGVVKVKPSFNAAPTGNPFTVIWADSGTNTDGNSTQTGKFDVQYKVQPSTTWKVWKNDTTQFKAVFGLNNLPVQVMPGKKYDFRVRSENPTNTAKASGFSPTLTVTP
jgi:plastocyanin